MFHEEKAHSLGHNVETWLFADQDSLLLRKLSISLLLALLFLSFREIRCRWYVYFVRVHTVMSQI